MMPFIFIICGACLFVFAGKKYDKAKTIKPAKFYTHLGQLGFWIVVLGVILLIF